MTSSGDPRQIPYNPPGSGGLALRQQAGNHISVRQAPTGRSGPGVGGQWGTLAAPSLIELPPIDAPLTLNCRLGYEVVPSTVVFGFRARGQVALRVRRLSEDRYACHVAVALVDGGNRRVASLVDTADGCGAWHEIEAGSYKIVVSLGMPVDVAFQLEVSAQPAIGLTTRGSASRGSASRGLAPEPSAPLPRHGLATATEPAVVVAAAGLNMLGLRTAQVTAQVPVQVAINAGLTSAPTPAPPAVARLSAPEVVYIGGPQPPAPPAAACRLQPVATISAPLEPRRAWFDGGILVLNTEYLRLGEAGGHPPALVDAAGAIDTLAAQHTAG